jgi:hypothetical protein
MGLGKLSSTYFNRPVFRLKVTGLIVLGRFFCTPPPLAIPVRTLSMSSVNLLDSCQQLYLLSQRLSLFYWLLLVSVLWSLRDLGLLWSWWWEDGKQAVDCMSIFTRSEYSSFLLAINKKEYNLQSDQKASVHLMITVQKTRKNILNSFNHLPW